MKKKILAVMLSAVLTVAMLVGCGDSVETGGRAETTEPKIGDSGGENQTENEEQKEIIRLVQTTLYNTNGDIVQEAEWEYEYDAAGNIVKDTYNNVMAKYEYDAAGNIIKATSYGLLSGNIQEAVEFEYNADGNLVKEVYYKYNADGSISEWNEIQCDASGNPSKYIDYNGDGTILAVKYVIPYEDYFPGDNLPEEIAQYDADRNIKTQIIIYECEYDTTGNIVKLIRYSRDLVKQEESEYNESENLVRNVSYNADGSISTWVEYEYDTAGNEIKEIYYNSDGNIQEKIEKEYDEGDHEVRCTVYSSNGSIIGWYEREYDAANGTVKYNFYGSLHVENENGGGADYRWQYLGLDDGFELKVTSLTPGVLFSPDDISIDSDVRQRVEETETFDGYWNIVLFGLDNFDEARLYKSSRSKNCIVISINTDTQEIRFVNINADTYLNTGDIYNKVQTAYNTGGAEQAIKMLNMNLDMNLADFISIGLPTCIQFIDGLGGIWVEVDDDIKDDINQGVEYRLDALYPLYGFDSSFITEETKSDFLIETTGYQQLSGLQVAAWLVTGWGDSLKMNSAILEQMQNVDPAVLAQLFGGLRNDIYTSLSQEELDTFFDIFGNNGNNSIMNFVDFPRSDLSQSVMMGAKGSCVVPMDLEANVVWLHQFLFNQENYSVSYTVQEIGAQILEDASKYLSE